MIFNGPPLFSPVEDRGPRTGGFPNVCCIDQIKTHREGRFWFDLSYDATWMHRQMLRIQFCYLFVFCWKVLPWDLVYKMAESKTRDTLHTVCCHVGTIICSHNTETQLHSLQTSGKFLDLYRTGGPVTTWKIQVLLVLQNFYRTSFFSTFRVPIEGLPTGYFLPDRTSTTTVFIGPPLFSPLEDRGPVDFPMSVVDVTSAQMVIHCFVYYLCRKQHIIVWHNFYRWWLGLSLTCDMKYDSEIRHANFLWGKSQYFSSYLITERSEAFNPVTLRGAWD